MISGDTSAGDGKPGNTRVRTGRIVIPKNVREELEIGERTKLLLTKWGEGRLLLQKLDVEELANRLEEELKGRDIDAIAQQIRKETDERIKTLYPDSAP